MNVLCLVLDRLNLGYLGAYGNSWIETPGFDRFAAESFLFDQAMIDSPRLDLLYRSLWQGGHALSPYAGVDLARRLGERSVDTFLLTDDPAVAQFDGSEHFSRRRLLDSPMPDAPAESLEETCLAGRFAELIDWLGSAPTEGRPFLAWCHFGALGTVWDAPRDFRLRYVEEGDPEPNDEAAVPRRCLGADADPDELVAVSQAYAAQVLVWDACFEALLEHLDESGLAKDTLVIVMGVRGFPLGEHGLIGDGELGLFDPLVHVPLAIRRPGEADLARSQAMVEPADVFATILDVFGLDAAGSPTGQSLLPIVRGELDSLRDRQAALDGGRQYAFRTKSWHLTLGDQSRLFATPDDFWNHNDVADRCQEIVESLQRAFEEYQEAMKTGTVRDLPPLPPELA